MLPEDEHEAPPDGIRPLSLLQAARARRHRRQIIVCMAVLIFLPIATALWVLYRI